jgi:hypothetical protein
MTHAEKVEQLAAINPDALMLDGFDEALVGIAFRNGQPALAVYDYDACIRVLMAQGLSQDAAVETFEFNTMGAWMGPMTPLVLHRFDEA